MTDPMQTADIPGPPRHAGTRTERLMSGLEGLAPSIDDAELAHARAVVQARLLGENAIGATRIGRYVVLERFAEGGMGLVFAAYDAQLDRKVAVKLLRRDLSDASLRTRMVREAQAMAKLSHPNVAQVYEVGEDHGRTFITMEFITGETFARWQQQPRPYREVLAAYAEAGCGLAAAHAAGLVHRDFKPDNVMMGRDGRVRVLDFGLARTEALEPTEDTEPGETAPIEDALRTPLTHAGSIMGTPAYMSPEQLTGGEIDARADQFGFCVALWEALYGQRPFEGATRALLAANVTAGRIREPPRDAKVPGWIRVVVQRGLAVAPAQRYPSMHALLDALDRDPSRRRRRLGTAIAGVAVLAAAFGVWSLDRSQRERACADEAGTISAVWNPDARASVREALLGVGPAYATSTVDRIIPQLDAWATAWANEREHNCTAVRVEKVRTVALGTSASECLDETREAFATLVEMLGAADDVVLQNAATSTRSLPEVATCADEDALRRRAAIHDDSPALVAEQRRRLAAAQMLLTANRPAAALAGAEAVLEASASLGDHPVRAQALALSASAHGELADHPRAVVVAEEAVVLAMRIGDDALTLDAMSLLTSELVETGARERAIWWTVPAGAIADRLGESDDLRGASLLDQRAILSGPEQGLALYREALAIREHRLGPDHPLVGGSASNVGAALERIGASGEAKAFHERGLAIREHALGPDHPHVANSLVNAAQQYIIARDFPRARDLTARALEIWERALGPKHRNCALALGNLAAIYMYMDDHAGAAPLLERAIMVIEHTHGEDSPFLVQHLVNLATIAQRRKDYDEAVRHFERGLAIGEIHGAQSILVAHPLVGLSEIDLLQGRPADATKRLERALAIHEHEPIDRPNLAHTRYALARALWSDASQHERALELAKSAITEYRALDGDWSDDIAAIDTWIAKPG